MQFRIIAGVAVAVAAVAALVAFWPSEKAKDQIVVPATGVATAPVGDAPMPSPATSQPLSWAERDPVAYQAALKAEREVSARPEAAAPQTFIGPDGKPHKIEYNNNWVANLRPEQKEMLEAAMLEELKANPEGFAQLYALNVAEVREIAEGKRPFPKGLLQ